MSAGYEVKGAALRAYIKDLSRKGWLDAVCATVSAETRAQLASPPPASSWIDGAPVEDVLRAVEELHGEDSVRVLAHDAQSELVPLLRPLIEGTLRLFGTSPATIFSRFDLMTRSSLRGAEFSWTAESPTAGVIEVRFTGRRGLPRRSFVSFVGSFQVVLELCGKKRGAVAMPEARGRRRERPFSRHLAVTPFSPFARVECVIGGAKTASLVRHFFARARGGRKMQVRSLRWLGVVSFSFAIGCTGSEPETMPRDFSMGEDLSNPSDDLSIPIDLGSSDQGGLDLANGHDLAAKNDLSTRDLTPPPDLSFTGDLASPSGQIQAVRDAADQQAATDMGPMAVSLPVTMVYVTYVKQTIGADTAGFFVQAVQNGPALFVNVDPTTITPTPTVGDLASFVVTGVSEPGTLRSATSITGYTVTSAGNPVAGLLQDLTAATDLVTGADGYESELITLTGTTNGAFTSSGTGFLAATIATTGVPTSPLLKLRVPAPLVDSLDLASGCAFKLPGTPLWRFSTGIQPSAWVAGDISITSCQKPKAIAAAGTAATTVVIDFDRLIDPASIVADGSQFTFTGGLTATAATVASRRVTLTTSAQTPLMNYTVTVAATVTDTRANPIDPLFNSRMFLGFVTPAGLQINEVNANITNGIDLIELLVTSDGNISGMTVTQDLVNPTTFVTLPNLNVTAGDLIVIHMTPAAGVTTELTTKGACGDAACYGGAWDVRGAATGITYTDRVLAVHNVDGSIKDAVPFVKGTLASPSGFPGELQMLQAQGLWKPIDCSGSPCTYTSTTTAQSISANWDTSGTTAGGKSCARKTNLDTDQASDWAVGNPSFGATNP